MRYFNHSSDSVQLMLKQIGRTSLDDLFASVPEELQLKGALDLPAPLDEMSLKRDLLKLSERAPVVNFIGAGACQHFVPEWVSQQLLRAEWYTSYTPYQPEVSQGTLQAIFEFQSMVASLFGLEVANASLYDGATALVEALLMAIRATNKKSVALSLAIHPEYRATVSSYLVPIGIRIIDLPFDDTGVTDLRSLEIVLKGGDIAAIAFASPNFFGRIEGAKDFLSLTAPHKALIIGCTTDPSASALWSSFGEEGADIAVGEGLGFVGALNLGGPGVGLLAARKSLLRQIPGRLVGYTTDKTGRDAFTLTLSTREQHIRREKATSNICTNHNLMALAFSMTMASYGKSGLIALATKNLKKTLLLRNHLRHMQIPISFNGHHYNETVINLGDETITEQRLKKARQHNIVAGLKLSRFYPALAGHVLINTTELHSDQDIKNLALILSGGSYE